MSPKVGKKNKKKTMAAIVNCYETGSSSVNTGNANQVKKKKQNKRECDVIVQLLRVSECLQPTIIKWSLKEK